MEVQYGCSTCSDLGKSIRDKKILFTIVVLLIMIATGGLIFAIFSITQNWQNRLDPTGMKFEIILALCGAILLFLFDCLGFYTLATEFFLLRGVSLGKIYGNTAPAKSRSQIVPVHDNSNI